MTDDVSTIILKVRELRYYGCYADAAGKLEEYIQRLGPDIRLVVELSETFLMQGFFGLTVELLDKHLASYDVRNDLTAASGQLIRCFSHFLATSQFKDSLSRVESIFDDFLRGSQSEFVDDATVWPLFSISALFHG